MCYVAKDFSFIFPHFANIFFLAHKLRRYESALYFQKHLRHHHRRRRYNRIYLDLQTHIVNNYTIIEN